MSAGKRRVLLLRPEGRGLETARQLEAMGAAVVHLPMQRIEFAPDAAVQGVLRALRKGGGERVVGVCLSRAAARAVVASEALVGAVGEWLAVGPGSAGILEGSGLAADTPEQYSSEGLLGMAQLRSVQGVRIVLCKGEGGREVLAEALRGRGAEVTELALYRRAPVDYAQDADMRAALASVNAVLLTSVESTRLLAGHLARCGLAPEQLGPAFALSERIARLASEVGFDCVAVEWPADMQAMCSHMRGFLGL